MAKRFTDTDKWKREWFCDLPAIAKLAWLYICDNCDHQGVWPINFRRMTFDLGEAVSRAQFEGWFEKKYILIEEDKYFFPSFISFQQGDVLRESNKAHQPIIRFLEQYKLLNKFAVERKPLPSPLEGPSKGPARSPSNGKGNVSSSSSPGSPTKTVASGEIERCSSAWKQSLKAMGHERNLLAEEERLIFLALKNETAEMVEQALLGAAHEPKIRDFNPKRAPDISRILGDRMAGKPPQIAKFVGYANTAAPAEPEKKTLADLERDG